MRNTLLLTFCVAGWVLHPASARAASVEQCNDYVAKAVAGAQQVRQMACGYDLSHPQWSTDPMVHRKWCLEANSKSVNMEASSRTGQLLRCGECRSYANAAMAAVADNIKLKCGFGGARWSEDAGGHFNWCMGLRLYDSGVDKLYGVRAQKGPTLAKETDARNSDIAKCKEAHAKESPVVPPKVRPVDAAKQKPRATVRLPKDATTETGSDVPGAHVLPSPKTKPAPIARKPSGSSGVDTVNPGGGSAMDRLSGDSQLPSSSKSPDDTRAPGARSAGSGTPAAGGGGAGGGGGAVMFRGGSGSNIVAPPAGGGLR
jgi:hypothetical protein